MTLHSVIYQSLVFLSVLLAFCALYQGHKKYIAMFVVLVGTEIVEIFAQIAVLKSFSFLWLYHVFVPFEYSFLALYLRSSIRIKKARATILITIPIFIIFSLAISHYYYHFSDLPGINLSIKGLLLFVFCMLLLFNVDVTKYDSIFANPDLWIALGILIFEGGTFFYNCVFTKLFEMDSEKALKLFGLINKPLNLCLYIFINIGFLCLLRRTRYTMR